MNAPRTLASALLALHLLACQSPAPPPPTPTPDRAGAILEKARRAHESDDWESEALALREAVEMLEPGSSRMQSAREACVRAMVEAGGNCESFRLWSSLEKKNGPSPEATKMKQRARKLMLRQAEELQEQVRIDLKGRRPQAALCTAQASLSLCMQAGSDPERLKAARATVKLAESALGGAAERNLSPSPQNSPSQVLKRSKP
jgi:hypothetical protein